MFEDALFADHELFELLDSPSMTTAANYNSMNRQTHSYHSVTSSDGRLSPLPPPIPPLPSDVSLRADSSARLSPNVLYADNPQIQQIYSSTITISKTVYDTDASGNDEVTRFQSTSPGNSQYNSLSRSQTSPYSTLRRSQPSPHNTLQRVEISPYSMDEYRQAGMAVSPSLVSGNLSELDTLLDDLSESTKQYTLTRDRRAKELSCTSPTGFDNSKSGEPSVGVSYEKVAYTTPPADRSRSGSVQRELEIPKLSDMPRTSPTPLSALYPDVSSRQGQTLKDQPIPVHLQPPLVSGPSVSPLHSESLVKIYKQADGSQSDFSNIAQPQTSYIELQYTTQNYGSLPKAAITPQNYGSLPHSAGVTQNYGITQRTVGVDQNYASLPHSGGLPQNYGTLPQSAGVPQSYGTLPQSGGFVQTNGFTQQSGGFTQNYGSLPQSAGVAQNYGSLPQSAGVAQNYGSLPQSAGVAQNYGSLPQSAGVAQNYGSLPQSAGVTQSYGSYSIGAGQNFVPEKPMSVSQNFSSQQSANVQPVGAMQSQTAQAQIVRQKTPQRWDENHAGRPEFSNIGGYAEIQPVDRNSNGRGTQNTRQPGLSSQLQNVEESIQPVSRKPQHATKTGNTDLDDLMASIAEFDMAASNNQGGSDPVYAQPMKPKSQSTGNGSANRPSVDVLDSAGNQVGSGAGGNPSSSSTHYHAVPDAVQLGKTISSRPVLSGDQMHGQLSGDFDENGLPIVAQGDCAACGQAIVGQVLMALGKLWHVQHFACVHCKHELGTSIFYERDGLPYCVQDYQELFLPKCAGCGEVILENCLVAFNQAWHMEHFRCAECDQPIIDDKYYEEGGRAFCSTDYFRMYAPLCAGCDKPIMTSYITALHRNWHSECFVCAECQLPFDKSAFYELNGSMYCERHFYAHRGAICASCTQPIVGRCVTALYKKYHPEHFVCSFCLQPLNKGTFKEQSEKPYCHPCFGKLFG